MISAQPMMVRGGKHCTVKPTNNKLGEEEEDNIKLMIKASQTNCHALK